MQHVCHISSIDRSVHARWCVKCEVHACAHTHLNAQKIVFVLGINYFISNIYSTVPPPLSPLLLFIIIFVIFIYFNSNDLFENGHKKPRTHSQRSDAFLISKCVQRTWTIIYKLTWIIGSLTDNFQWLLFEIRFCCLFVRASFLPIYFQIIIQNYTVVIVPTKLQLTILFVIKSFPYVCVCFDLNLCGLKKQRNAQRVYYFILDRNWKWSATTFKWHFTHTHAHIPKV